MVHLRPNTVCCTDITYIWTQDGFAYLNCVMDLYARKIITWTLADTMEVSTVIETINKAKACRNTDLPLIIHSDRGSYFVLNLDTGPQLPWHTSSKNINWYPFFLAYSQTFSIFSLFSILKAHS